MRSQLPSERPNASARTARAPRCASSPAPPLNERIIGMPTRRSPSGSVVFEEGKGGLPVCKLTHKNGGTARCTSSARVTSW